MTRLYQDFSKWGFYIIFTHYNDLRAFIDTFDIDTYDDLLLSLSLRGYVKFFGNKVYSLLQIDLSLSPLSLP
jgi:hypothetical protein